MSDVIFTRIYHSLEEEFGYLSKFGCIEISNGICWLAAACRRHNYKTEIIDALPLKLDNDALVYGITKKNPKYVGISACTMDVLRAHDFAAKLKKAIPKTIIIVGGPHITAVPEETMERLPAFDIGVLGEGETTIVDLLDSLEGASGKRLNDVDGIVYRDGEKLLITRPRSPIEDLDSLPLPAWDMLPNLRAHYFAPPWTLHSGRTATIITSRGCPFQCIYCDRKVFGNHVRFHSARYVIDMLKTLHLKHGISHFRIGDDNFIVQKKRLHEICDSVVKEKLNITWSCLARADSIDSEALSRMKRAGCWSVAFGVETGSQKIHDLEKKHIDLDKIARAISLTKKAGIKTISFNMIGHPLETIETIKETIGFNKRIKVDEFKTQFMVPFPGTELYKDAEKYGTLDKDWSNMGMFKDPVFIPYGLTKEDMIKWNKKGFISFYLQPRIILSYLTQAHTIGELKMMVIGAITIIGWKIKELFAKNV